MLHWLAVGIAGVVIAMFTASADSPAQPRVVEQDGFTVVGIPIRTTNAKEMTAEGVIGKQWDHFFKQNLLSQIPNKVDSNILAVYTDYESDSNGAYTFIIGAKVSSVDKLPPGMMATKIPHGRYAVFTSEKGLASKVVPEAWGRILATSKSVMGGDRAYKADFEVYDQRAADPQNAQVDLYIGIR